MEGSDHEVVLLRCFDGGEFIVPSEIARRSGVAAAAMETDEYAETGVVRVPGVAGRVLDMVVDYWFCRDTSTASGVDPGKFDEDYAAALSHDMRIDMIHAAHDLEDEMLLEALRSHVRRVYHSTSKRLRAVEHTGM